MGSFASVGSVAEETSAKVPPNLSLKQITEWSARQLKRISTARANETQELIEIIRAWQPLMEECKNAYVAQITLTDFQRSLILNRDGEFWRATPCNTTWSAILNMLDRYDAMQHKTAAAPASPPPKENLVPSAPPPAN